MANFKKTIGFLIKQARNQRLMTQNDLANEMGVNRCLIANLETGRARIYLDQFLQIHEILKFNKHIDFINFLKNELL